MAKKTSASDKAQHAVYKANQTWAKNRKRKLEKALKRNPENQQIINALKNIVYRRNTPNSTQWNKSQKNTAQQVKSFCGHFDRNIFNANKDIVNSAWGSISAKSKTINSNIPKTDTKHQFSIKNRAHYKGVSVWNS